MFLQSDEILKEFVYRLDLESKKVIILDTKKFPGPTGRSNIEV
jgi:hypothetical protein